MDEDWTVLMSFLPERWRELASETGALKGLRKDNPIVAVRRARRHPLAGANPARQPSLRPVAVGAVDGGNDRD